MPIYEYECAKCGKRFEYQQSMSEPPKKKCEKCGGKLERLISQTAFHLKGGGWYKDLYSKKPGGASTDDSPGDRADSKPDPKSEPKSGEAAKKGEEAPAKTEVKPAKTETKDVAKPKKAASKRSD